MPASPPGRAEGESSETVSPGVPALGTGALGVVAGGRVGVAVGVAVGVGVALTDSDGVGVPGGGVEVAGGVVVGGAVVGGTVGVSEGVGLGVRAGVRVGTGLATQVNRSEAVIALPPRSTKVAVTTSVPAVALVHVTDTSPASSVSSCCGQTVLGPVAVNERHCFGTPPCAGEVSPAVIVCDVPTVALVVACDTDSAKPPGAFGSGWQVPGAPAWAVPGRKSSPMARAPGAADRMITPAPCRALSGVVKRRKTRSGHRPRLLTSRGGHL
jgi:hypothetical protein